MINFSKGGWPVDTLSKLQGENRFAEFILVAWGLMEVNLDHSIQLIFRIDKDEAKALYLINQNFSKKLRLLYDLKYLRKDEYKAATDFEEERNRLFHSGATEILSLPKRRKQNLMTLARQATDALFVAEARLLRQSQPK